MGANKNVKELAFLLLPILILASCGNRLSDNKEEVNPADTIYLETCIESASEDVDETDAISEEIHLPYDSRPVKLEHMELAEAEVTEVVPEQTETEETSETADVTTSVAENYQTETNSTEITTVGSSVVETLPTELIEPVISEYIPDTGYYLALVNNYAESCGYTVINEANWDSYQNPVCLDSSLTDSVLIDCVSVMFQTLSDQTNGTRTTFNVWIVDETASGNQTHGPGFYLYVG